MLLDGCNRQQQYTDTTVPQQKQTAPTAQQAHAFTPTVFAYSAAEIQALRRAKDEFFRYDSASPLPEFDRARFKGLRYFEPDPTYCVQAQFEPLPPEKPVIVETTSAADYRRMQRVGVLRFVLAANGRRDSCTLTGYVDIDAAKQAPPVLALYFKDATNNDETYEAGRYLELPYHQSTRQYTLDFNRAFAPYCAYNMLFSCPLVPRENWLNVRIEAGEKRYIKP
jgi:uncharacterized protein (DUF1684 family)